MTEGGRGRTWSFIGAMSRPKTVAKPEPQTHVGQKTTVSLETNDGQLRQLYRMLSKLRSQVEERSAAVGQLEAANTELENALRDSLTTQEEQAQRIMIMHKALREAQEFNEGIERKLQYRLPDEEGDYEPDDIDELQAFIDRAPLVEAEDRAASHLFEPVRLLYGVCREVQQALAQDTEENQTRILSLLHAGIAREVPNQGATWTAYLNALLVSIEKAQLVAQASWEHNDAEELVVRLDTYPEEDFSELKDHPSVIWRSRWGIWLEACLAGVGQEDVTLVSVEHYDDYELLFFSGLQPLPEEELSDGRSNSSDLRAGVLSSSHEGDASAALLSGVGLSQAHELTPVVDGDQKSLGLGSDGRSACEVTTSEILPHHPEASTDDILLYLPNNTYRGQW